MNGGFSKALFGFMGMAALACAQNIPTPVYDQFVDSRDGKAYTTVKVGNQTWMAQNLNYEMGDSKCFDNKSENCDKYGRLYTWRDAKKACPEGWHLPSKDEFEELRSYVGNTIGNMNGVGKALKSDYGWLSDGRYGWVESPNGTDDFGFTIQPAGISEGAGNNSFDGLGGFGFFWTSSEYSGSEGNLFITNYSDDELKLSHVSKNVGLSLRCIQGSLVQKGTETGKGSESNDEKLECGTPQDYDDCENFLCMDGLAEAIVMSCVLFSCDFELKNFEKKNDTKRFKFDGGTLTSYAMMCGEATKAKKTAKKAKEKEFYKDVSIGIVAYLSSLGGSQMKPKNYEFGFCKVNNKLSSMFGSLALISPPWNDIIPMSKKTCKQYGGTFFPR